MTSYMDQWRHYITASKSALISDYPSSGKSPHALYFRGGGGGSGPDDIWTGLHVNEKITKGL